MGEVTRRGFVGLGAAALAGVAAGCEVVPAERRQAETRGSRAADAFELEELTFAQLADGMADGRWTAQRLTELYLERIAAIDGAGPTLRSVIETNPDALAIAEALDAERAAGRLRGPLHGIPILLKDNIGTADRMQTTAGSNALQGHVPSADSFAAAKLRDAGAILLGKANLSEWANFRSTRSSSGWSARGGQCRNPYVLDRNPCGSSSGSGAATSANLCAGAIGTETDGSIVCPSSANGVVGIKPTIGLVSRTGIVPISHTQDTAGPMTRTVTDAAVLLGALTGIDAADAATARSQGNAQADYSAFLDASRLQGARIGVARDFFGFHEGVEAVMDTALAALQDAGAELIDITFANLDALGNAEWQVLQYEFKADIAAYLAGLPAAAPKTLADLIAWNEANAGIEMPYFRQEIFEQCEARGPLTSPDYIEALATCGRLARDEGIDARMTEHDLVAIIAPTGGPAWTTDLVNGDHFGGGSSTLAAVAGYPAITVPAGHVHGLPVGLSFFGRAWSEPTLIGLAYGFEQATLHRSVPTFRPTLAP